MKQFKEKNKKTLKALLFIPSLLFIILLNTGCSAVFTCSISGTIVDTEDYANDEVNSGISDAKVFLYTDEKGFNSDLASWQLDNTITPDKSISGVPKFFIDTTTNNSGEFSFNGLIWNEYFSEYGKTGDRKEVYLLFYHKNYGLCANPNPVYVVSDVTNRLSVIELKKILNTSEITGTVYDEDTQTELEFAAVNIWIPESWEYNSDGSINTDSGLTWGESPSYSVVTDNEGKWSREITYKMKPSSNNNKGTTIVRLTFNVGGYIAENSADSDITDGGWDINSNGTIEDDENMGYYQTGEIKKDSYNVLNDIYLANEFNSSEISGKVVDSTGESVQNVAVEIYVPESWTYSDENDPESINSLTWPTNPTYRLLTNGDGEYSQNIEYERLPSVTNNLETTKLRIVFILNNYTINNSTDEALIDQDTAAWDIDEDGDTEDDPSYYESPCIYNDLSCEFDTITIKATRFTETLSGQVVSSSDPTTGQNGVEVWLFFEQSTAPAGGDEPDYIQMSRTNIIAADQLQQGYFQFLNLIWEDEDYTGNQSRVDCILYLPDDTEAANGTYSGSGVSKAYKLTSGSENFVSLTKP